MASTKAVIFISLRHDITFPTVSKARSWEDLNSGWYVLRAPAGAFPPPLA